MEALRIATAGSVDDGKSTLIGRLLHDSKTIMEDQLASVTRASNRYGDGSLNLALLTDGLKAEREQGITIDVAYRYFATPARRFVLADSPGHVQYTRNMVTATSSADVAIVLIDATKGVTEQTRRHTYICAMLRVRHIVVAVNKMDLVDWQEDRFNSIINDLRDYLRIIPVGDEVSLTFIPVSARDGDNVVDVSPRSPWYSGDSLLHFLEHVDNVTAANPEDAIARLDVQWTLRNYATNYRGLAGKLTGSSLSVGDQVTALPSGHVSTVTQIDRAGEPVVVAYPGQAISVALSDQLDIGRGDVLIRGITPPPTSDITIDLCWMIDTPLTEGSRIWWKHGTQTGKAVVTKIIHKVDVATASCNRASGDSTPTDSTASLQLNELGRLTLALSTPIYATSFEDSRESGRMILVDEQTHTTAGAGLVV